MLALLAAAQVIQIVVGARHTCSLLDDGTVSCWGWNGAGQLGDGTTDDHATPKPVEGLTDVVSLAAGRAQTCARRRDGEVLCWGQVGRKQQPRPVSLGTGDIAQMSGPCMRMTTLRASCQGFDVDGVTNAVDLAAQDGIGCVAHASGAVSCWFSPDSPSLVPRIRGAVEVAVSQGMACSRDRMGAVWCWQWGFVPRPPSNLTLPPMPLPQLHGTQLPVRPKRLVAAGATALAGGFDRVCAVSRGEVRCWGSNLQSSPLPALGKVTSLALGDHSCAVRGGHDVVCWGNDDFGQLGNGWADAQPTPLVVPGVRDAIALETSFSPGAVAGWTCARRAKGGAVCWGKTSAYDTKPGNPVPRPLAGTGTVLARGMVARWADKHALAANDACTITLAGRVRCEYQPVKAWPGHEAPGITDAAQITEGGVMDCARERAGAIACWKDARIKTVPAITDAIDLASGGPATCAVRADHSVWCWIAYQTSRLVTAPSDGTPVKISGLPEIARISLGADFACALAVDGSVWCWGDNSSGELGDGTRRTRDRPARVVGLEHVVEISAGTSHTCARLADGQVACWGGGTLGELGTHAGDRFDKPVAVVW